MERERERERERDTHTHTKRQIERQSVGRRGLIARHLMQLGEAPFFVFNVNPKTNVIILHR